jgi:hypothetical protein
MKVAPVDQRDLDRPPPQPANSLQTAEPAADDDDAVAIRLVTARSVRRLRAA